METRYECKYFHTKDIFKETYRYMYFKRRIWVILDVILGILLLLNLVMVLCFQSYDYFVILYCIVVFLLQWLLYKLQVSAQLKRESEIAGDQPIEAHYIFTDTHFHYTVSTGAACDIPYEKIKRVVQTKNLMMLWSKANLLYVIPKDAFVVGDAHTLTAFLKGKGIKVK